MANELIKGIIKAVTAIVTVGFATKVGNEGRKNFETWKADRNMQSRNNTQK